MCAEEKNIFKSHKTACSCNLSSVVQKLHINCAQTPYLPPNSTVLSRFIGVNMPHVPQIPMQICQMSIEGYILTYWLTSTLHMFFLFVSSRGLYVCMRRGQGVGRRKLIGEVLSTCQATSPSHQPSTFKDFCVFLLSFCILLQRLTQIHSFETDLTKFYLCPVLRDGEVEKR